MTPITAANSQPGTDQVGWFLIFRLLRIDPLYLPDEEYSPSSPWQVDISHQHPEFAFPGKQVDTMATKRSYRVVMRSPENDLRMKDYLSLKALLGDYSKVGIDDSSTDLTLRGEPVLRGLVGPMAEDGNVVRYETPEVFESLTKKWFHEDKPRRRPSRAASEC